MGNREALLKLWKAIDRALRWNAEPSVAGAECFAADGTILDPNEEAWRRLELPYTDKCAADHREDVEHPGRFTAVQEYHAKRTEECRTKRPTP